MSEEEIRIFIEEFEKKSNRSIITYEEYTNAEIIALDDVISIIKEILNT